MNYRALFNLGINIVAMVIFAILIFVSFTTVYNNKKKSERIFTELLISTFVYFTFNTISYALRNEEVTDAALNITFSTLKFIALYITNVFIVLYCVHYFEIRPKYRRIYYIISISLCVIATMVIILNSQFYFFYTFNRYRIVFTDYYPLAHLFTFICLITCLVMAVVKKTSFVSEKIAFIGFSLLPLVVLILHISLPEYSILTIGLIASFLFHFLFYYIRRGQVIAAQQRELSEQQIRTMISQIQPHFIYNCLSSISYLTTTDPKKAASAIDDFSSYLRVNFSNINQTRIVPFDKELEHTKAYLRLEKMRFEDRVNIVYDIKALDFVIPSLTLQPLVENAVKHGICKKDEGGTIIISTWEDEWNYYIKVSDDGVGFDINQPNKEDDDRAHVGLKNVKDRLTQMSFAKVDISSKINIGTVVTITIPKSKNLKLKNAGGGN